MDNKRDTDVVIVVSDHGFTEMKGRVHIVNYLIDKGLTVLDKQPPKGVYDGALNFPLLVRFAKRFKTLLPIRKTMLGLSRYSYLRTLNWQESSVVYREGSEGVLMNSKPSIVGHLLDNIPHLKDATFDKKTITLEMEEGYEIDGYQPNEPLVSMPKTGAKGTHHIDGVFMANRDYRVKSVTDVLPLILKILEKPYTDDEKYNILKAYEGMGYV